MEKGEVMTKEEGYVASMRSNKQDGGRIYIIGYRKERKGKGVQEIRVKEMPDTNVTFSNGHKITIDTRDDSITVQNHSVKGILIGKKV